MWPKYGELRLTFPAHGEIDHAQVLLEGAVAQRDRQPDAGDDGQAVVGVATELIETRGRTGVRRREGVEVVARVLGHGAGEGVADDGVHTDCKAPTAASLAMGVLDEDGATPHGPTT